MRRNTTGGRNKDKEYFQLRLDLLARQRPALERSHWSESTVQTTDHLDDDDDDDDDDEDDEGADITPQPEQRPVRLSQWPNFSTKRNTVPKRPPMKAMDSIENFIKRGGWKRRGIVFQAKDAPTQAAEQQ
jgi:hypothetical protein